MTQDKREPYISKELADRRIRLYKKRLELDVERLVLARLEQFYAEAKEYELDTTYLEAMMGIQGELCLSLGAEVALESGDK